MATFETTLAFFLFALAPILLVMTWRKGFSLAPGQGLTFQNAPVAFSIRLALMLGYVLFGGWLLWNDHVGVQWFIAATAALSLLWELPFFFRRHPPPDDMVTRDRLGYSLLVAAGMLVVVLAAMTFLWAASRFIRFH